MPTGTVVRNRKKAVRTADSGISSRGKAVLISSLPEVVTDDAPDVIEVETSVYAKMARVRCARKLGSWFLRMMVTSR